MRKKVIGIFVCTLLIATITPIVSGTSTEKPAVKMIPSVIDQQQLKTPEIYTLLPDVQNWQQFKNRGETLESVDLHIGCYDSISGWITLAVAESLTTSPLTGVSYNPGDLPEDTQDWFTFDVPDVELTGGKIYYIIVTFGLMSDYRWSGSHGNPYKQGASSHPDADWDFAFRTVVDKSKTTGLESPFLCFHYCDIV
jgi:hypothetical protein